MIRRRFLGLMTLVGAGGLGSLKAANAFDTEIATYKVTGFTCITCAVGLETMLQREKGVVRVQATYPEAVATVTYNPKVTSDEAMIHAIREMGFEAHRLPVS